MRVFSRNRSQNKCLTSSVTLVLVYCSVMCHWIGCDALALQLPPLPSLIELTSPNQEHFFSATANWVIPGRVLQGRHPGSGRGSPTERVRKIRQDGQVTTFVCLQAELPPLELAPVEIMTTMGGSNDWKTKPMTGFKSYATDAMNVLVNDEPPKFVHFGIRDMDTADSLADLSKLIKDLVERVQSGEVLYVHCWGGKGRAGLVCSCLLLSLYEGISSEDALNRISMYANTRNQGSIGTQIKSPETDAQKQQVREFYELMLAH